MTKQELSGIKELLENFLQIDREEIDSCDECMRDTYKDEIKLIKKSLKAVNRELEALK